MGMSTSEFTKYERVWTQEYITTDDILEEAQQKKERNRGKQ